MLKKNDYLWRIDFMMLLDLDAEALNNSGTNGNVLEGRTIELKDGSVCNAITGNTIKHVYFSHLHELIEAVEKCDTCKIFSPMKNGKVKEPDKRFSASGNRVKECTICDISGFMNAEKDNKSEKRKTVASFSWGIAKNGTRQEDILYSRVDPTEMGGVSKKKDKKKTDTIQSSQNINDMLSMSEELNQENNRLLANTNENTNTQFLYHRPIRSSEYAMVFELDLHRIGFDDEKQVYVLDKEELKKRIKIALKGIENLLTRFGGAMTNTNLPHVRGIRGIVTEKTDRMQRLTKFSPLNDNFIEENEECSNVSYRINNTNDLYKVVDNWLSDEFLDSMVERNMNYVEEMFK